MKISIITATYNRADTIRDTIKSILTQTYKDWEHIIIDGASNDNTLDIINEYKDQYNGRLKLVSEKDKGIYDAMNKGIALASGDIVGILNSDDLYFENDVLHNINEVFEKDDPDAIYGGIVVTEHDNLNKIIRIKKGSIYPKGGFRTGWHPAHPSFYVKKRIYDKYGCFDLSFGTASDMELMIRFIEREHIFLKFLPKIMVKMRFGGASNNSIKALLKSNQYVLQAFEKNGLKKPNFYLLKKLWPKAISIFKSKLNLDTLQYPQR